MVKNSVGTATTLEIVNDTIIYGVWTTSKLTPSSNYLIIEKTFEGNDSRLPENLTFTVTESSTDTTIIVDVSINSFTYDKDINVYTYKLPIYLAGSYTVEEFNYVLNGYTFDVENSTKTKQTVTTDLTEEVKVSFENVYTKNKGVDFHNSGFSVEKADSSDRTALAGAVFTLTDGTGKVVQKITTDDSGYAIFMNLVEGTYTLKETVAPSGYYLNNNEYTVVITLISSYEVYSATQNAYLMQYEYDVVITPDDHYNYGASRVTVYNTKITGSLTISKEFGVNSEINSENFSEDKEITVTVTGDNDYSVEITLNSENNWTETLTGLELGSYKIEEVIENATIEGYELNVSYGDNTDASEVVLTESNIEEDVTITNTYTKNIGTGEEDEEDNDVPKTGDEMNIYLYLGFIMFCVVGFVLTIVNNKKQEEIL